MKVPRCGRWSVLALALVGGLIEFTALHLWARGTYANYSDGVYALSSRQWLHGLVPYRAWAGAQPPPVFIVGTVLLAIADDITALRIGMGALQLISAGLVALCVLRLDGRPWLALAAGAGSALLPTELINHAQLIPETIAAPLILGGALACAEEKRDWVGVLLLALAAWSKVAFLAPALGVTLLSGHRWRNSARLLAAFAVLMGGSVAVFGTGMWRETVTAQLGLAHPALHLVAGVLGQEAWNDGPLAAGVLLFAIVAMRRAGGLTPLGRTLLGGASGGMLLALSVYKLGSFGYVLEVAEGPALALGVCAVAWSWAGAGRVMRVVVVLLALFVAAQSVSVLVDPENPRVAIRAGASSGVGWGMNAAQVRVAVAATRACPAGEASAGPPEIAFLAGRRMAGNQPDQFMLEHAATDARFDAIAQADQPVCPQAP